MRRSPTACAVPMGSERYASIILISAAFDRVVQCTWPEGVPARKKSSSRKNPQQEQSQHSPSALDSPLTDTRPSTAGSATISEASTSTPPTRNPTPPKREPSEAHLPPLISRRAGYVILDLLPFRTAINSVDSDVHLSSVGDIEGSRRQQ